jgi:pimeloyl-ACP methyl ester carboxylesterase
MQKMRSPIAGWSAAIVLAVISPSIYADEPWQRLPPTPELPAKTISRHATVNGASIWYADWNRAARGTPVLLLHGGYANANYFGNLIPFLIQHGYRVIAIDSRGHGRSTRTEAPYTYHLMASDVIGVLDALKVRRVSLVGWSDGGCIGLDIAINNPDRLRRLFAFGADANASGLTDDYATNPVFSAFMARVRDEYRKLSPTPDQWDGFDAAVNAMWVTLPNFTQEQLHSIHVPTTIADGEHDEGIRPEHTRYIAAAIPGAHLVILPNVSHFAMLQDPAAFNAAVLNFLRGP